MKLVARTNNMCDPYDGNLATCCSTLHLLTIQENCLCEKPTLSLDPGFVEQALTLQQMCVDSLHWDPSEHIRTDCDKDVAIDWEDVGHMMDDYEDYEDLLVFRQPARATESEDSEAAMYPDDSGEGCAEDDYLCLSMMKAAREYEQSPQQAQEEEDESFETLGTAFSDFVEKEVATGDVAVEIADSLYDWASGMMRDMRQVASAMDVFGAFGFSLETVDIELETSEDDSVNGEDDDLDVDIDLEFEIDGDEENPTEALKNAVLELDLEIDEDLTVEQLRKIPAKIAKALGKASLPKELMEQLPELVKQAAQQGELRLDEGGVGDSDYAEYERYSDDDDEQLLAITEEEMELLGAVEHSVQPSGASSTEADTPVDDDGEDRYWRRVEAAQWRPRQTEHKVPITLKSAASLTPLTVASDVPVRLEVNPDDPEEIFIIIEADDDEELVLTLENESGEAVSLVVEDAAFDKEANVDLLSGNSAIIRTGDAADQGAGFSLDLVPYLLEDIEQVTAAVAPLKRAPSLKEFSVEVTATHEVRVHNWQGTGSAVSVQEVELTVQASGPGASLAAGGDVVDIVIDLDSGMGDVYGAGENESITIELELQVESAEDLDITVDIEHAFNEERPSGEEDPYVVIEHLQDYIFRLECVFVLVYTTVCLALMAIFYYLYELFTSYDCDEEDEDEDEEEEGKHQEKGDDVESSSLTDAATEMIAGAQTTLNVLFSRDLSSEEQKAACADGFYAQLPEGDAPAAKQ